MSEEKQKVEAAGITYDSRIRRKCRKINSYVECADDGSRILTRPDGKIVSLYLP